MEFINTDLSFALLFKCNISLAHTLFQIGKKPWLYMPLSLFISWLTPLLWCLFLSRLKENQGLSSFLNQKKWDPPALWHKRHLFMALNYWLGKTLENLHSMTTISTSMISMTSTFYCPYSIFALIETYLKSVGF